MWSYLREQWRLRSLRVRYQRIVQEQLLNLLERQGPLPVSEDPGHWTALGSGNRELSDPERTDTRTQARTLAESHPHVRNWLRLLDIYVVGPGLNLQHTTRPGLEEQPELVHQANRLWQEFLEANQPHFSYREYARRTWRDGECFLRKFSEQAWPPPVRFVDPELIADHEGVHSGGIVSDPHDVETVLYYLKIDPQNNQLVEEIPATDIVHTKYGVDANQKRGVTCLLPVLDTLEQFEHWMNTELQARRLQTSLVLWRKVHGPPNQISALVENQSSQALSDITGGLRKERIRPGTIVTTSQGTDLQFLQPNTNFGDSMPLGRMLLLCIAAGAGLPEFMLTADASNGNFASTLVAEGPAVKMFQAEQQFFAGEFQRLWRWVMREAIAQGLLPGDFFDRVTVSWAFPQLVNRDRSKERMADARLVDAGVLSRAEVARRDGVDPHLMRRELDQETGEIGH